MLYSVRRVTTGAGKQHRAHEHLRKHTAKQTHTNRPTTQQHFQEQKGIVSNKHELHNLPDLKRCKPSPPVPRQHSLQRSPSFSEGLPSQPKTWDSQRNVTKREDHVHTPRHGNDAAGHRAPKKIFFSSPPTLLPCGNSTQVISRHPAPRVAEDQIALAQHALAKNSTHTGTRVRSVWFNRNAHIRRLRVTVTMLCYAVVFSRAPGHPSIDGIRRPSRSIGTQPFDAPRWGPQYPSQQKCTTLLDGNIPVA